jgi:hypothetical protein
MSLRMKLLAFAILVPLALVGVYYRVPQVAIFAFTAALYSPWQNNFSIPLEAAKGWASVTPQMVTRTTHLSGTAGT